MANVKSPAFLLSCTLGAAALVLGSWGLTARAVSTPEQTEPDLPWLPAAAEMLPDDQQAPVQVCFAEGTSEDYMAGILEKMGVSILNQRYYLSTRWSGGQGNPLNITWSLVPDGTLFFDAGGSSDLFARMDSLFAAQGGRATWILRVQMCFDRWAQLAGCTFTRVTVGGNDWDDGATWGNSGASATRGQIRIGMRNIDGVNGTLAYTYLPSNGDVVMDRSENWASSTNQNRFFRNTLIHELGHSIGMVHVCSNNSAQLLEPFLQTSFDGPQHDDIRGAQRHYGDQWESNNTAAAAFNIGTVEQGSPITLGTTPQPPTGGAPPNSSILSLDANGEVDYFRFTVNGPRQVSVTITPRGFTYDNNSQAANGSCNTGVSVNSLAIADLNVQIIGTDGTTVLGTADTQPAGSAETLSDVNLPAASNYYVRVYEGNSPVESQLYLLDLSVTSVPCEPPSIAPTPPDSTVCGSLYTSPPPSASGTPPFTWSLVSGPAGMTINSSTGVVSWPNPLAAAAPYDIAIQASSQCGGGSDTDNWQLTVAPGDFNGDGVVGLPDVAPFVDHLLGVSNSTPCAADVNLDGNIDGDDAQAFVDAL